MSNLGAATVAIGVFDGVHVGHQSLLRDTVTDADGRGVQAVAVTFDRDPDQVVSPSTAAPQLLTLADKLRYISDTGIDVILVVPFTPALAEMAPESFVDSTLVGAMRPASVHVGRDFHFGSRATGDITTLQRLGLTHGFEVCPHDLVTATGSPVTSTRIRALIAAGEIETATALLGRRPRVSGRVRRGRGEGAKLGFPTANIAPVPFAALPADGVYAGRAILEDGIEWAAAISVGTPPTFPEARDYLEAHLVAFEGDLYEQMVTLEFFEKLRDQQAYASLSDLTDAIAGDVADALEIAGFDDDEDDGDPEDEIAAEAVTAEERYFATGELEPLPDFVDAEALDFDPVFDPAALQAAEDEVRGVRARRSRVPGDEMVVLADGLPYDKQRLRDIAASLVAADIEAVWHPYPPSQAPLLRLGLLGENTFRIEVWNSQLELARDVLQNVSPSE